MNQKTTSSIVGSTFEMKDYIDAATDAASRTRTVTIILVIATVLIGIGFWNSFTWSWSVDRVKAAYDTKYDDKFKLLYSEKHLEANSNKAEFEKNLQEQVVRAYIDNIRFIRIPFFGIAFDVNDLAPIGGLSLIIILLMLRFSLSREIKNLNVAFREAYYHNQLCHFYHMLAMRVVLTVPEMKGEKQNWWLFKASQIIYFFPLFVFFCGILYDYWSTFKLGLFTAEVALLTLGIGTLWFIVIIVLSWKCWERINHINKIWEENWKIIDCEKHSSVNLDDDLVEEFGNDEAVNKALRTLKNEPSKE